MARGDEKRNRLKSNSESARMYILGKMTHISVLNYEMGILINVLKWLAETAITYSLGQHSRHVC